MERATIKQLERYWERDMEDEHDAALCIAAMVSASLMVDSVFNGLMRQMSSDMLNTTKNRAVDAVAEALCKEQSRQ